MRAIDAETLKLRIGELCINNDDLFSAKAYERIIGVIEAVPTIEPEVRRGRWIEETEPDENGNVTAMCNQCYHTDEHCKNIKIPYCWYCGADMREVKKNAGTD